MSIAREIFYIVIIAALGGVLFFVYHSGVVNQQVKNTASLARGYNYAINMEVKKDAVQTRNTGSDYLARRLHAGTFLP